MDIEKALAAFIQKNFISKKGGRDVAGDESLLDSGLIDSTGIFELVNFLEQEFGIEIDDEEVIPDNFDTIDKLVAFVGGKKG